VALLILLVGLPEAGEDDHRGAAAAALGDKFGARLWLLVSRRTVVLALANRERRRIVSLDLSAVERDRRLEQIKDRWANASDATFSVTAADLDRLSRSDVNESDS
jgi:hypothetical protein